MTRDPEAARDGLGALYREEAACEGDVGAVCVELGLGVEGQGGQVDQGGAEAGDPADRSVDLGDPLDDPVELGGRQGVGAEARRGPAR
ncbi:hypothetical protein ACFVZD_28715 [Streptomyces sp. NPDC058287]|uniref:hypothetical protein n=1 Tax=Streptomyces sp. NPDC058287 TaxID=3346423 RepID=UPI0036EC9505